MCVDLPSPLSIRREETKTLSEQAGLSEPRAIVLVHAEVPARTPCTGAVHSVTPTNTDDDRRAARMVRANATQQHALVWGKQTRPMSQLSWARWRPVPPHQSTLKGRASSDEHTSLGDPRHYRTPNALNRPVFRVQVETISRPPKTHIALHVTFYGNQCRVLIRGPGTHAMSKASEQECRRPGPGTRHDAHGWIDA